VKAAARPPHSTLVHAGFGAGAARDALRIAAQDQPKHRAVQCINVPPAEALSRRTPSPAPHPCAAAAKQRPKSNALFHSELFHSEGARSCSGEYVVECGSSLPLLRRQPDPGVPCAPRTKKRLPIRSTVKAAARPPHSTRSATLVGVERLPENECRKIKKPPGVRRQLFTS